MASEYIGQLWQHKKPQLLFTATSGLVFMAGAMLLTHYKVITSLELWSAGLTGFALGLGLAIATLWIAGCCKKPGPSTRERKYEPAFQVFDMLCPHYFEQYATGPAKSFYLEAAKILRAGLQRRVTKADSDQNAIAKELSDAENTCLINKDKTPDNLENFFEQLADTCGVMLIKLAHNESASLPISSPTLAALLSSTPSSHFPAPPNAKKPKTIDFDSPTHKIIIINEPDPYAVLGIQPGSSKEEIRAAYKRAMLRCHPDKGGSDAAVHAVTHAHAQLIATTG